VAQSHCPRAMMGSAYANFRSAGIRPHTSIELGSSLKLAPKMQACEAPGRTLATRINEHNWRCIVIEFLFQ
jgi:hypothetical protein